MPRGILGFIDIDKRLKDSSARGDDLDWIKALVDFVMFCSVVEAMPRPSGATRLLKKRRSMLPPMTV
jgi:hypothetical protein